jgi:hypothetical protein
VSPPRFVVCGVPRCGTTSLYRYLQQHPQVEVSRLKEVNFLSWPGPEVARRDLPWMEFPVRTFDEYERLFARSGAEGSGVVAVDVSPSCFHSPVAIDRIRRFVPDAGLVVLLRDPVARAYSAYLNRLRKRYETRPADEVLVPGDRAVDNGFYANRLADFLDAFGPERVRVWLFDDLTERTGSTMADVLAYLGVDAAVPLDLATAHNRSTVHRSARLQRMLPRLDHRWRVARRLPRPLWRAMSRAWSVTQTAPPPLPGEVEKRLRQLYADDVRRVADMIGRDLGSWLPSAADGPAREETA